MRFLRNRFIYFVIRFCAKSSVALIILGSIAQQAAGQVTPNGTVTGTEVTHSETESTALIEITGGQRSGDGANLFHEFEQFNVNTDQTAQFVTAPNTQNILSTIVGGPSSIDGLLQVLGSQADLYIINPAGILFGPNVQLNLPGSLTATTATGVGFDNQWLNLLEDATGSPDYSNLVGQPTAFDFAGGNSGSVVNLGNLTLGASQSLSLMGSTVVNTGEITVPGGNITLTAVEGGQLVRIGQGEQLLSLEVSPVVGESNAIDAIAPSIGELLTGNYGHDVNTLVENADGSVSLVSTKTVIPEGEGTVVVSGQVSTADIEENGTGGEVNIFGAQVALLNAGLSAAGRQGGGTLRIGGDARGSELAPTARRTYVGNGVVINSDATHHGDGGQIYVWSDESTHFYGSLSAQGGYQGGNGGFAEISGKLNLAYEGEVNLSAPQGDIGTLLFDPDNILIKNGSGVNTPDIASFPQVQQTSGITLFVVHEETLESLTSNSNIVLEAAVDIIIEDLTDNVLSLSPGTNIELNADSNGNGTGSFSMNTGDTIRAPGGTVRISAGYNPGVGLIAGHIDTQPTGGQTTGGDILLNANNYIQTGSLNAGNGKIELTSDSIDFRGNANSVIENSVVANSVVLQPTNTNSNIVLGGSSTVTNSLHLSSNDIAALSSAIRLLEIGRSDSTGQVTLLADVADGMGNSFTSPTHIRGDNITVVGPDLDTTWTIDRRPPGSDPVNQVSNYSQLRFADLAGIVGGSGNDTITFLDARGRLSSSLDGGGGDLTLVGDDLYVPETIQGSGALSIRTRSANTVIELGGTNDMGLASTLNLLDGELAQLVAANFSSVTIGDDNTGAITLKSDLSVDSAFTLNSRDQIDTTAGRLTATGRSPLTLTADGDITTGEIRTEGGNVAITSTNGNIGADSVDARGLSAGTGEGGNIALTGSNGLVQITNTIGASNDSVATNPGNSITLTHGGNGVEPFIVGQASSNGALGTISNQLNEITNGTFLESFTDGALSLVTQVPSVAAPPEVAPPPEATPNNETPFYVESSSSDSNSAVTAPNLEARESREIFSRIETAASTQFEQFLSLSGHSDKSAEIATLEQVQDALVEAQKNLDVQPALVYVYFVSDVATLDDSEGGADSTSAFLWEGNPTDQLEVMLIPQQGDPIRWRRWGVTRADVEAVSKSLRYEATSQFSRPQSYLPPAQQLYRWIMQPMEDELAASHIDNLAFIMDDGLRTIPLAMLHDGESFLVEQYSLGLMPTFSLTELETASVAHSQREESRVLAMGASRFSTQPPLPAVEAELSLVAQNLWEGESFLNEQFTMENLKAEIERGRYDILHLATHAVFNAGDWDNSYIQLWDERITLRELNKLGLDSRDIGLIILSACNTALGDRNSEYGFAGFAVNAGSESALASLWPVSDEGTLGFMTQF
ncbi:MAG: CHAT domain-containing protein, partial [Cyanobacteria bacterium P01_C01_bin.69]